MKNRGFIDDGTTQSWGEFTKTDLLKKIYRNKNLENMSEEEVNQMLEDLILTCVNEALRKVDSAQSAGFGKYNIPGLM